MDSTAQRPLNLINLPQDCIGRIVQKLEQVSDDKQPLCRSLLYWAQTSKDSTGQLAVWTKHFADPVAHGRDALCSAFESVPPMLNTLRKSKAFAPHISTEMLDDVAFLKFEFDENKVAIQPRRLALALITVAHAGDRLTPGVAESFLVKVETMLCLGKQQTINDQYLATAKSVIQSVYEVCGLISKNHAEMAAYPSECVQTLQILPQSFKSLALYTIITSPAVLKNDTFEALLSSVVHQFVPIAWDQTFMEGVLGEATLAACGAVLRKVRLCSPEFIVAYAGLLGAFIEQMPREERDFRIFCNAVNSAQSSNPNYSSADSDDERGNGEQKLAKKILDDVFNLLVRGHDSELCKQSFVVNFVQKGFMTAKELGYLMAELSAHSTHINSFFDVADRIKGSTVVKGKKAKGPGGTCVIS